MNHIVDAVLLLGSLGLIGWVIADEIEQAKQSRRERVRKQRTLDDIQRRGGRL